MCPEESLIHFRVVVATFQDVFFARVFLVPFPQSRAARAELFSRFFRLPLSFYSLLCSLPRAPTQTLQPINVSFP
ncbi:hypothetical protein L596_006264 [Steinernema carpocapsae]|uniref:Uncharacterized protein n=1 Tax=Steinernema carpocapsae TaxID=34508 RepID=A0A4U8V1J0_STECR|nr:hypothetical protein L596_006264 [Steinernema carpocapsae]